MELAPAEPALRATWIDDVDALAALAREWDALCDACPWSTPFQRPAWVIPALRHLGQRARVVVVRRGRALVGLLPLAELESEPGTWALAGTGPSDALDVIAREHDVARAALEAVSARRAEWRVLELHELADGSPLLAAARAGHAGRVIVDDALSVSPVLAWPEGAETLDDVLSASWARRVRYDRRRAARESIVPEVAREHHVDEAVDEALRAWRANHEARWAARGEPGALTGRHAFLDEAVPALVREGRAELWSLRAHGALAASYLVLRERAWAGLYLGGFDPALARSSPLVVLIAEIVERLARDGVRDFDFLRGAEPYKYQWGARDRVLRRVRIEP
ncbi:GNAT family N-acetyltransferase [Sandaracinus amylolyticus]|uniref:Cellulose biosynthesis (CelD)-like protein n=1 Tax=Sandaracinus amylolyticus TaxID=927083 RepID=A0A0F6W0B2_9BACT|nr:GNAT family N-acetyltransferase [Sandaracinus amylolyticus]AKF04027.1 cellulose biosynthesis (CelD)-like protein [Sandaracinus amylolyticus]